VKQLLMCDRAIMANARKSARNRGRGAATASNRLIGFGKTGDESSGHLAPAAPSATQLRASSNRAMGQSWDHAFWWWRSSPVVPWVVLFSIF